MTEEHARTKECPKHMMLMVMMQLAARKEGRSDEIINDMTKFGRCSASACMHWEPTMIEKRSDQGYSYIDTEDGKCGLSK